MTLENLISSDLADVSNDSATGLKVIMAFNSKKAIL
jgi:hypothetical protein